MNTLSCKRLDAKRHYVILAKGLDGIWPVQLLVMPVQCCAEEPAAVPHGTQQAHIVAVDLGMSAALLMHEAHSRSIICFGSNGGLRKNTADKKTSLLQCYMQLRTSCSTHAVTLFAGDILHVPQSMWPTTTAYMTYSRQILGCERISVGARLSVFLNTLWC